MTKPPFNHFSPVLANAPWAEKSHYTSWSLRHREGRVRSESKGRKQWGRERRLYPTRVEIALGQDLETAIAPIYQKLLRYEEPIADERKRWAQFVRSQIVRTPTFIRYERAARSAFDISDEPTHDRVGCECCEDLTEVTGRNWLILQSHRDDHFVRTDNPVFYTGFLNDPSTVLYYPLSPKLCFVAAAMNSDWEPVQAAASPGPIGGIPLEKGGAHLLNFYFARSASTSLILRPSDSGEIAEVMFGDVLGIYPQPPFDLHRPDPLELNDGHESIRTIMSIVDGVQYQPFQADEVPRFSHLASS